MMQPVPLRPDEQVAGGFIALSLGGQPKRLPELKRHRNREWTDLFNRTVTETLGKAGELKDVEDLVQMLTGSMDVMLDLLVAYDESGALGGREWIDHNATDREIYEAMRKVTGAAFPFGNDLLTRIPGIAAMVIQAVISSRSTSSSRPSTGGRRRRSNAA